MKRIGMWFLVVGIGAGLAEARKPAPPIDAKVLGIEHPEGDTAVTVDAGSERGIAKTSKCSFLDADMKPVPDVRCLIVRIDKKTTVVKASPTVDAKTAMMVRFIR